MINNTPNLIARETSQRSTIQANTPSQVRALSSSPAFSAFTPTLSSSPLMQNIIQLIQVLIQQLQQETNQKDKPQQPATSSQPKQNNPRNRSEQRPQTSLPPEHNNTLRGTAGDDRLQGTRGEDRILGLAGNDRLYGRQNDDALFGGAGNDRLYGGKGNDTLRGGTGNDYLSGGRGENKLFGGAGDDTLYSRLGSDVLDGGSGNDTARIRASIDEFSITFTAKNTPVDNEQLGRPIASTTDRFILTHKETGQTIEASNIETFRFNDARLSADELKQRATIDPPPNDELVELSPQQKQNILGLFNPRPDADAGVRVIDKDASGKVSVGDVAVIATGDASSVSQQFRTLSAEDVAAINDTTDPTEPTPLNLSDQQQEAIGARFNRKPPPNLFDGTTTSYTGVATDNNGDNKLGVGDSVQLRITGGLAGLDETTEHVLTADDMAAIETDRSNPLLDISDGLSFEQNQRLHQAIFGDRISLDSPSIQSVFDHNSDKKLSVGDSVVISRFSESTGASSLSFHTLTQGELDSYLQGSESNQQARADLEANKQKWTETRPDDYSFTLRRSGFLFGDATKPVDLTVNGNMITNAQFADGSAGPVPDFNQLTADELFNTIENALDNNAAEVQVTYNDTTGLPESIFIDRSRFIADEELSLSISNFNRL